MKVFRRWLIRLAVIAVALGALMALVVGLVAENYFPRAVGELDRQLGSWQLKRESFDRGWWSSRAAIVAESDGGVPAWRYREHLSHGPLVHGATRLGWIGGRGTLELANGSALAEVHWWLSPAMMLSGGFDFSPAGQPEGRLDFTVGDLFSRIDFTLQRLSYRSPDTAAFEGLDGSGFASLDDGRIEARLELNARRLRWFDAVVDGPDLTIAADQSGELIGLRLALAAAHAGLEQSYRDGRLEVVLERLHRPTLETLAKASARIARAGLAPSVRNRQLTDNLLLGLPGMLQHRPRLTLQRLEMHAPQGPLAASGLIGLNQTPPPGYLAEPAALVGALDLSWELALPEALGRHWIRLYLAARGTPPEQVPLGVEEILARLGADGLVVLEEERLLSQARLAEQVLMVNGRPMALPQFE